MRIVRKVDKYGQEWDLWLEGDVPMMGTTHSHEHRIVGAVTEFDAAWLGTTLSALHRELTEGGEGNADS